MRPIISNIGTATHKTAQYINELLTPLSKSINTIESSSTFVQVVKNRKVPERYEMISFDVESLFTNEPLQYIIDIVLNKIYVENKINTKIKRNDMKNILYLCTKNVPFTFNGNMFHQVQ